MVMIALPDGSEREFGGPVALSEVAQSIGPGLAKAALAGEVDGCLVDTDYSIASDAAVSIVTAKSDKGLEIIRHSCAHLLAMAVKALFPAAQVTIGPVIENGFFYDFFYERSFTPEDLERIEAKMGELVDSSIPVKRIEMSREEAIELFTHMGEEYKVEIIHDIPAGEILSFYQQDNFIDLCRGPHVPNTSHLKAFKLTKVAGAYWRGDANNVMLQRIYGTAWADKKALKAYLHRMEEALKRDHRKIGKALDLFHLQEEAPGMVFWHPNGWAIWQVIEHYIREMLRLNDYQEIRTPQLVDRSLWEKSGHWEMYRDMMFTTESESRDYAVKPMNCPCHVQIFKQGLKSYRDLPLRLAEFGSCHRNEPSGTLSGIMRVRNFVQDDAHIFCTEDQMEPEVGAFYDLVRQVYGDFGLTEVLVKISTRPEKRVGSDAVWDRAEKALKDALNAKGVVWEELPGEGAFYGPKIEFTLVDCIGRQWQCGTLQVDFSMPERLGASYVDEQGERQTPVMLHRAILGSLERFIGVLIEHYEGRFPVWLAPQQVVIMNISDAQGEYCREIERILMVKGYRAHADLRNEKIGFKIREHTLLRVPYQVVVGHRELEGRTVSVRTREGVDLGSMALDAFVGMLESAVANKGRVDSGRACLTNRLEKAID